MALLGTAAIATAAMAPKFAFLPESRIWVDGTSTVRAFTCAAAEVKGTVGARVPAFDVGALGEAVEALEVVVDVAGLECGNSTMNEHMRKALKVGEHGQIRFSLTDYTTLAAGTETRLTMNGIFAIAGQERPIAVEAVATAAQTGAIRVKGSKVIAMTEWGVKPPSLFLGTMKVHPNVRVNFDVVMQP